MSSVGRRAFVKMSAAVMGASMLTPKAVTGGKAGSGSRVEEGRSAPVGSAQAPGFYGFALGEVEVVVLSDGYFHFPMELLGVDVDPLELQAMNAGAQEREEYFRSRLVPSDHIPLQASPVLIRMGSRQILVDSGFGGESPPSAGHLGASLEAAGSSPGDIDMVILTHGHPDHLGGLVDPATGEASFPEAEVVLSERELAFWADEETGRRLAEVMADGPGFRASMHGVLQALGDRVRTVGSDEEVLPGIRSIPSPGHTPGHICLGLEAGGKEVLFTGDAIAYTHVAFEHPEWQNIVDADPEEAGRTRRRLLDHAATDGMLIVGYHFPFPGLGYALPQGGAYRWHPAGWRVLS